MKKTIKQLLVILLCMLILTVTGCQKNEPEPEEPETLEVKDLGTEHESEFGGVYLKIGIDDFNSLGFQYGDSVDIVFSNVHIISI